MVPLTGHDSLASGRRRKTPHFVTTHSSFENSRAPDCQDLRSTLHPYFAFGQRVSAGGQILVSGCLEQSWGRAGHT